MHNNRLFDRLVEPAETHVTKIQQARKALDRILREHRQRGFPACLGATLGNATVVMLYPNFLLRFESWGCSVHPHASKLVLAQVLPRRGDCQEAQCCRRPTVPFPPGHSCSSNQNIACASMPEALIRNL